MKKDYNPTTLDVLSRCLSNFAPPPKITGSEWADKYLYLSEGAEPGKYHSSRAAYQRGFLDAFTDPAIHTVTIKSSVRIGKTVLLLAMIGYYSHYDPCSILYVLPTKEVYEDFSKEKLVGLFRDVPALKSLLKNNRGKESDNTIKSKRLKNGGIIRLVGMHSPASIVGISARVILLDEVDRYPESLENEGNPIPLVMRRAGQFWNRKVVLVSTPTTEGNSKIEKSYEQSDKRKFFVPCPHCGEYQTLDFKKDGYTYLKWNTDDYASAYMECKHCQGKIEDKHKQKMLLQGRWEATDLDPRWKGHAGFYINALYSPWVTMEEMAKTFTEAKNAGPDDLRTWYNTMLGWVWKGDEAGQVTASELYSRREPYSSEVPLGVGVLTSGTDVQPDRLETTVIGHGKFNQTWVIDHKIFYGNTSDLNSECWKELDTYLDKDFKHESGKDIRIYSSFIDAGYNSDTVHTFSKIRNHRLIFSCRGSSVSNKEAVSPRPSVNNKQSDPTFYIGLKAVKDKIYRYLRVIDPESACYIHFPEHTLIDEGYFKQLNSEYYDYKTQLYKKKKGVLRNESLDTFVYAMASYMRLDIKDINKRVDDYRAHYNRMVKEVIKKDVAPKPQEIAPEKQLQTPKQQTQIRQSLIRPMGNSPFTKLF